ncbi:hypothetical protein Pint_16028 [Pistacia integerrima]|uniref:Uncharacterized protein n=1 Tax=Pistacia integerrima TaxID=434235 RepID=A0ACC0ZC59_9ROSI|nr:hypothetical protein Pint_16028 [Pistacia integerrima]
MTSFQGNEPDDVVVASDRSTREPLESERKIEYTTPLQALLLKQEPIDSDDLDQKPPPPVGVVPINM